MRYLKPLMLVLITIVIAMGSMGCSKKADPSSGTSVGTQTGIQTGTQTGDPRVELPDLMTFELGWAWHLAWVDKYRILFASQTPDGSRKLKELDLTTGKTREFSAVDHEVFSLSSARDRVVIFRQSTAASNALPTKGGGGLPQVPGSGAPRIEVVVVDLTSGDEKTIAELETGFIQARWSPSEDLIAVSSDKGLFTIRPDGSNQQTLVESQAPGTPGAVLLREFTWRPDGKTITYGVGMYEGAGQISEIKLGEKDPVALSSSDDAHSPLWSPDGTKLLFVRTPYGQMTSDLFLLDPASKVEQKLAEGQSFNFAWVNAQELLFVKGETGESKLFRMPLNDPAGARMWLNEDGRYFGLAMSPEGDRMAYFHQITDSTPPVLVVRKLEP